MSTLEIHSPFDGQVVGEAPIYGHDDAAAGVARARRSLGEPVAAWRRAQLLDGVATSLRARREEFAQSITSEVAKPIAAARDEVDRAVETLTFSAIVARTLGGDLLAADGSVSGEGKVAWVRRVPVGVVLAISPFNFPLNLLCHKVGPSFAVGCPVIAKPASTAPLTALRFADLLEEQGLPCGWVQVLPCENDVAAALVEHPDVAMVSFTGSPTVGWALRAKVPRKRVSLELGNNAPVIIEPDADWMTAARKIAVSGYAFAGQSCVSTQRVLVHASVADEFIRALTTEVARLGVGDPNRGNTVVSSLITTAETERVGRWIREALREGARLVYGGDLHGTVLEPTLLADVTPSMRVSRCEVFGPVVGVAKYSRFDDAVRLANATEYGLQAAIFTRSLDRAFAAADRLEFGGVMINEVPTWRGDHLPYGGIRGSGNTREGPAYAAEEMTERRLIVVDLEGRAA